jgi:hypothetical protein
LVMDRDWNAAVNILRLGREPAWRTANGRPDEAHPRPHGALAEVSESASGSSLPSPPPRGRRLRLAEVSESASGSSHPDGSPPGELAEVSSGSSDRLHRRWEPSEGSASAEVVREAPGALA